MKGQDVTTVQYTGSTEAEKDNLIFDTIKMQTTQLSKNTLTILHQINIVFLKYDYFRD